MESLINLLQRKDPSLPRGYFRMTENAYQILSLYTFRDEDTYLEYEKFLSHFPFDKNMASSVVWLVENRSYSNSQVLEIDSFQIYSYFYFQFMAMSLRHQAHSLDILSVQQITFPHLKEVRRVLEEVTGSLVFWFCILIPTIQSLSSRIAN